MPVLPRYRILSRSWRKGTASRQASRLFFGRRPLPFGGSHLRLPSGPAGVRTTTGSLSALARPTPYQLSHRVASRQASRPQGYGTCSKPKEKCRMKQSCRQASMQVLNSSVARPWKLEQNTSGQASRQASRASRLWKLEQNTMTKKGTFFGPQNVRKSRRAKMGLPSSRFQPQLFFRPTPS